MGNMQNRSGFSASKGSYSSSPTAATRAAADGGIMAGMVGRSRAGKTNARRDGFAWASESRRSSDGYIARDGEREGGFWEAREFWNLWGRVSLVIRGRRRGGDNGPPKGEGTARTLEFLTHMPRRTKSCSGGHRSCLSMQRVSERWYKRGLVGCA